MLKVAGERAPPHEKSTTQWELEVAPGESQTLDGTYSEVLAQALRMNPDWELVDAAASLRPQKLRKRGKVVCDNWLLGNKSDILEGIKIAKIPKSVDHLSSDGDCGVLGCVHGSAVIWCLNVCSILQAERLPGLTLGPQDLGVISSLSKKQVIKSARSIVSKCGSSSDQVSGQRFEPGNWSTIVRGDYGTYC